MPRYQVIQAEVEAFALEDGRMVVIGAGDDLKIMPAEQFTQLFEAVPDRRAKAERRTKPRGKKTERRTIARKTRGVITAQELAESAPVAIRADRHPQRDRAGKLYSEDGYKISAIAKATGVNEALLRYWKRADKWKEPTRAAAAKHATAPVDDGWMQ